MTAFFRRLRQLLLNNPPPAESGPVVEGGSLAKIYGDNLSNPDALINRANKRATNGDLEGALGDFDEAIALNPAKATAYFNRGFLHNSLGKFEAAIHDFSEAIALLPDYDEAYFQRGNSYRQLGDFQRAIQDYSQAIRINPYCIKAYYKRADSRAELGDYPGALTDYSQVILRVPKDANAYCQRGIFLSQSGELAKAIDDFSMAIEHNPRLADAYFHRGYCLAQLGEAEKAAQDFSEALLHDPNHQAAYTRAYALGMLKEAPASPSKSTTPIPASSLLEESVPISVERVEDLSADIEDELAEPETHSTTVPLEPMSLAGFFQRANNRIQRGDLDGAIADYSKIIDHDPQNSQAYFQRGQSLGALGESQAAMEDLNQAMHWARVHSLGLMRDFSGELSTTLESLKQDLADLSYQRPFKGVNSLPASSPKPEEPLHDIPPEPSTVNISSQEVNDQPSQPLKTSSPANPSLPNSIAESPSQAEEELAHPPLADADTPELAQLHPQSHPKSTGSERSDPDPVPPSQAVSVSQTLDRAIAEQTRAIERNPLDAEAFFNRGQSRALAGDLQGAIEDYSWTIRLDPNNREAYVKRARCRSALGDEAAAQEDLNHAIRHQPIGLPNRPQPSSQEIQAQQSKRLQQPIQTYQLPASGSPTQPSSPAPPAPTLDDATRDVASLFMHENKKLQSASAQKPCTHAGNSPGNQFCIHCGEPLSSLSRYSSDVSAPAVESSTQPTVKPADSNHKQRLKAAEGYYDQGLTLFKQGDRQGSLQSLSAGLKIFLEQREMQRYQQTLNLMQDVAHALNDTGRDEEDPDENLLL